MKTRSTLPVLVFSLLLGTVGPTFAADPVSTTTPSATPSVATTPSRADQVTAIQDQYNPIFDSQYARLMAVKKKLILDANAYRAFKAVLADFLDVRRVINSNLQSASSDLSAVKDYAEEETGEFSSTLNGLEAQAAKIKTLSCAKGKVVKKVSGVSPKCPKGYKKK